jgi:hypothetical protein
VSRKIYEFLKFFSKFFVLFCNFQFTDESSDEVATEAAEEADTSCEHSMELDADKVEQESEVITINENSNDSASIPVSPHVTFESATRTASHTTVLPKTPFPLRRSTRLRSLNISPETLLLLSPSGKMKSNRIEKTASETKIVNRKRKYSEPIKTSTPVVMRKAISRDSEKFKSLKSRLLNKKK